MQNILNKGISCQRAHSGRPSVLARTHAPTHERILTGAGSAVCEGGHVPGVHLTLGGAEPLFMSTLSDPDTGVDAAETTRPEL